jgi:formylmethanofuran dehydrogenase subunit C
MSGFTLSLRQVPALRLDLRGLTPTALAALGAAEVERLPVGCGNTLLPLAEFFRVAPRDDDTLVFDGDCARCDRIGWQLDGGRIVVDGAAGDHAGTAMRGGVLHVKGPVRDLAGCEMAGGRLEIDGSAGDFTGSTLPGSLDGMRGGTLLVHGHAGARCGDRMRRGTLVVFGDVGDFAASRMVAGTLAVGGACGAHGGYGMRRGSVVFAGSAPPPSPTFVEAGAEAPVFWQLLARDLALLGGPFAGLPARRPRRHVGDLASDGKGEWIVAA